MNKINKITIKLGFFLLTIITLTTFTHSTTVKATCLANGKCSTSSGNNTAWGTDPFSGMPGNSSTNNQTQTTPTYHAPVVQQPKTYVAPTQTQQSTPTYHAPVAQEPNQSNYVAPSPTQQKTQKRNDVIPEQTQKTNIVNNHDVETNKKEISKQKQELDKLKKDTIKKLSELKELNSTEINNYKVEINKAKDKKGIEKLLNDATKINQEKITKKEQDAKMKKQKDEENKRNQLILWSSFGGFVLISSITGFIIYKKKINTK